MGLQDRDRQELNRMRQKIDSVRGAGVTNGANSVSLGPQQGSGRSPINSGGGFWGKIVNTGPNGDEDDYSDARYWVQRARIDNDETDPSDGVIEFVGVEDDTDANYKVVTASNLAEIVSQGHTLPLGQIVWVQGTIDRGSPPQTRYNFCVGVAEIWMQLTGATAIAGRANCWAYSWKQVQYVRNGLFQDVPAGLTDADTHFGGKAYNTIEANNAASGVQGNSIDLSLLPTGYAVKPVRGNAIVVARRVFTCDDTPVGQWIFSYENAVQGTCP